MLHIANPDALIATTNIQRAGTVTTSTQTSSFLPEFDNAYITTLSADAVPAIVAALPSLAAAERCVIADKLLRQWYPPASFDWRTWNYARWQAWHTVDANRGNLQTWACAPGT